MIHTILVVRVQNGLPELTELFAFLAILLRIANAKSAESLWPHSVCTADTLTNKVGGS
jgi:hypothetical protein